MFRTVFSYDRLSANLAQDLIYDCFASASKWDCSEGRAWIFWKPARSLCFTYLMPRFRVDSSTATYNTFLSMQKPALCLSQESKYVEDKERACKLTLDHLLVFDGQDKHPARRWVSAALRKWIVIGENVRSVEVLYIMPWFKNDFTILWSSTYRQSMSSISRLWVCYQCLLVTSLIWTAFRTLTAELDLWFPSFTCLFNSYDRCICAHLASQATIYHNKALSCVSCYKHVWPRYVLADRIS